MNDKVRKILEKGFLISSDAISFLDKVNIDDLLEYLKKEKVLVITKDIISKFLEKKSITLPANTTSKIIRAEKSTKKVVSRNNTLLKFITSEKSEINVEKKIDRKEETIKINVRKEVEVTYEIKRHVGTECNLSVDVVRNYDVQKESITPTLWSNYFRSRLHQIKKFLKNHSELTFTYSSDFLKKDIDDVQFIGLIRDKKPLSDGVIFVLEDVKGLVKVYIPKDVPNFEFVKDAPLDSVVGVTGNYKESRKIIYANTVLFPDVPLKEKKTVEEEVYIVFTGDFQIGNKAFLKKEFEKFVKWLKGENGNEKQKELARKVGYLIIVGDLVDGVGIYPEQEKELEIKEIEKQYEVLESYLLELPENLQIIIIPGNHDAVRLAEPQPPIPKEFLPNIYNLDNFYILSNPSYVKIHSKINILLYHGYPMDWYISEIPWIRNSGGYDNLGNVMKFMLQLRHLAPTHGSTPYVPYKNFDPLVIDIVPDIFVTGHIHRTYVGSYKNIDLVNASCFQGMTKYQLELGHKPDPGKVVLKNLKTGEFKILSFLS